MALGPHFRGDERGESSPDHQPFVPAEAGTQSVEIDLEGNGLIRGCGRYPAT
jgi:hypothetical protein